MTTREASFDHATEAEAWLANADDEYTRVPPIRENIRDAYQRAQVHAQLALVEQQRIANIIALSQATNPDGSRITPWALTHPVDDYSVAINDDIKKGLGL